MTALVITSDIDFTADAVVATCQHIAGAEVVRFDLSDFPDDLTFAEDGFRRRTVLEVRDREVDLTSVTAVWYRRPTTFVHPRAPDDPTETVNVAEATHLIAGLLRATTCLWVNRPESDLVAGFKVFQLRLARDAGLKTPRTLVTNDVEAVRSLLQSDVKLVYKLLHGALVQPDGLPATLLTTPVSPDWDSRLQHVRYTPCMFQEYIDKRFEVRVTVIGRTAFPVTILSQTNNATSIDWRATGSEGLPYGPYEPPPDYVLSAMRSLMDQLGIAFAAFDFIVDIEGHWVFLELNSLGQYQWLEEDLDLPLSETMARLLMAGLPAMDRPIESVGYALVS